MDDGGGRSGSVDEELLRYLARVLSTQLEVSKTSLFPANKQERLVIHLNTDYYPDSYEHVRLELSVYTNGDFHISYIESFLGETRRCRWDRHEQDHNDRDHFHPLPSASTTAAEDRDFPADITTLLWTEILPRVEDRLGTIWETESAPHD